MLTELVIEHQVLRLLDQVDRALLQQGAPHRLNRLLSRKYGLVGFLENHLLRHLTERLEASCLICPSACTTLRSVPPSVIELIKAYKTALLLVLLD